MNYLFILSIAALFLFTIYGLTSFYGSEFAVLLQKVNKARQNAFMVAVCVGLMLGGIMPTSVIRFAGENIPFSPQFSYVSILVVFLSAMVAQIIVTRVFISYYTPLLLILVFALSGASFAVAVLSEADVHGLSLVLKMEGIYVDIAFISLFAVAALVFGVVIPYISSYLRIISKLASVILTSFSVALLAFMLFDNISANQLFGHVFNNVSKCFFLLLSLGASVIIFTLIVCFSRKNLITISILINVLLLGYLFSGSDIAFFVGAPIAAYNSFLEYNQIQSPVWLFNLYWISSLFASVFITTSIFLKTSNKISMNKRIALFSNMFTGSEQSIKSFYSRGEKAFVEAQYSFILSLLSSACLVSVGVHFGIPLPALGLVTLTVLSLHKERKIQIKSFNTLSQWLLCSVFSFTTAFVLAIISIKAGFILLFIVVLLSVLYVLYEFVKNGIVNTGAKKALDTIKPVSATSVRDDNEIYTQSSQKMLSVLIAEDRLLELMIAEFTLGKRKQLHKLLDEVSSVNMLTREMKSQMHITIRSLSDGSVEAGNFYVQSVNYLRETARTLTSIAEPLNANIDIERAAFNEFQIAEINEMLSKLRIFFERIVDMIFSGNYVEIADLDKFQLDLFDHIAKMKKKQLKQIKNNLLGTKNSMLYLDLLFECRNLASHLFLFTKSMRDFKENVKRKKMYE
jgi:hypothetical protein